jgi:hypothetical protein
LLQNKRHEDVFQNDIISQLTQIQWHLQRITEDVSVSSKRIQEVDEKIIFLTQYEMNPKEHYDDHQEFKHILAIYKLTTNWMTKAFLGLVLLGAAFLAVLGGIAKWIK